MASINKTELVNASLTADTTTSAKGVQHPSKNFIAWLLVANNAAATVNASIEHSPDGQNWVGLATFAAQAGNGFEAIQVTDSVFPNLRAVVTLGGGAADVKVELHLDPSK